MPIYQITGKNGVVYRVNGPAGLKKEQVIADVLRQHPEAGVAPQKESAIEGVPLVGGILGQVADYPATFAEGLAGVSGAIAASTGAGTEVTQFLKDVAAGAKGLRSKESREEEQKRAIRSQLAEKRGTMAEIGAAARNFLESPFETTASVAGSALPFIAAGALTPETGGTSLIPIASMLGLGAVAGAGTIKTEVYDAVYEETKKAGASEEQARAAAERAQEYGGENLDQIALGAALGGAAAATGFAPAIARTIGSRASARVAQRIAQREAAEAAGTEIARKSVMRGAATGVVEEAVPEALQAGQERYAQNIALQREGFDVDPWQGVAGQAAAEGLASILLGGYGGARETNLENVRATEEQYAKQVEALPDNPTDEDAASIAAWAKSRGYDDAEAAAIAKDAVEKKAAVVAAQRAEEEADATEIKRFTDLGFNEETARTIVKNAQLQREAAARQAAEEERQRQEAMEARTAGAEPSPEPDITAPGMPPYEQEFAAPSVDEEEQAAMQRAYEAELGSQPVPVVEPTAPAPTAESTALYPTGEALTPKRANLILDDQNALDEYLNRGGDYETLRAIARGEDVGYAPKYSRGRRPKDTATPDMFAGAPVQYAPSEFTKEREMLVLQTMSEEEKAARQAQIEAEAAATEERLAAMQQRAEEAKKAKLDELQQAIRNAHSSNRAYTVDYHEGSRNPYRVLGPNGEVFVTEDNLDDFEESVGDLLPYSVESQETLAAGEVEKPGPEELSEPTVATRMMQDFVAEVDAARKAKQIDDSQRAELLGRLERPNAYKIVNGKEKPNDAIARNEVAARKAMERYNNAPAADKAAAEEALVTANQALASSVKNALLNPARAKMKSMVETRMASKREAKTRETAAQLQQRLGEGALGRPTQVAEELQDAPERLAIAELKADLSEKTLNKAKRVLEKAQQRKKRDMLTERKLQDAIDAAQKRLGIAEAQIGREVERGERLAAAKEEKERLERGVREERTKEREAKIDLAQQRVQKYRKGAEKQPGGPPKVVSVADVQAMVDRVTAQWKSKNPVVVVESIMDIPDAQLRRAIMRDNALDANGLVAPDGTIYLVADNLLNMEDAKAVLFHEALGHVGLEKLFRNNLDNALVTMYRGNAKLRADVDKWRAENRDAYKDDKNPLARAIEEVLAERSEAGQLDRSLFQKLAAIVRNFARRMGINLKISDGDVAAILSMAHDKVVKGDGESVVVKGLRYVTAWHGSPHDFEKFDIGKIGSGEGAQIFGWGLYFTDTKQIAENQYRDRLAGYQYTADGKPLTEWAEEALGSLGTPYAQAIRSIEKYLPQYGSVREMLDSTRMSLEQEGQLLAEAEAYAAERGKGPGDEDYDKHIRSIKNTISRWSRELAVLEKLVDADVKKKSAGKIYNVELTPKEDEFLLWHEPFYVQSPLVRDALRKVGFGADRIPDRVERAAEIRDKYVSTHNEIGRLFRDNMDADKLPDEVVKRVKALERKMQQLGVEDRRLRFDAGSQTASGEDIYLQLEALLGSPKAASLALLDAGIRGNKYLDGFSRGIRRAENPTYNYVLFSDEDVSLVTKYSRKKPKKVVDAAAGLSAGRRRVNDTLSTYGMMDGIEEATKAAPALRDAIAFAEDTSSPVRRAALKSMPSSGITGWLQRKAPKVYEVAEELVDTVRKMHGLRANLMAAGDGLTRDMADFVRAHGSTTLARAQFTNRINEIDFLAFDTVDEALTKHRLVAAIEKQLISNSNNKADTRRLLDEIKEQAAKDSDNTSVLKDKVNLSTPLKAKANELSKLAVDADKVLLKVKQLAAVTQRIRDSYAVKVELAKQKGGLELYKAERQYHKDILEARQALLDERIERGLGKEQATRIRDMRARMMREIQSPNERQKAGDLFWDLDADLFDKEYFPMLRDGQYWLRVKEDLSKGREEQFYTFESARELSQARRKLAAQMKEDAESSAVFEEGNDIGELQNTLRETDTLMQRVFDIVGKAREEYDKTDNIDMRDLVDSIYQTWLMTTPERSARRHFMHAKQIAGFSPNTIANLEKQISTNANELTKLAYAGRVRAGVSAVKDTINDPERPVSEKTMLGDFARELELRAEQELNPPARGALNTFVNALNRFSFFYYLTSAKTALVNFASIPIRVVPRLGREYGYAEGTGMWIKYMKMWDSLGRVKIERTNKRFGDYVDAIMPTVNGSNFVKNSEDLQWAMKAGMERGILMTTADTVIHNERINPLTAKGSITGKLQDLHANVGKVMGFLFTGTENISRQATFYMTFELEMKKQGKENPSMPLEERRQRALQKAMRIVDDTVGNFADWERPRIAKGEATRAFFLFKMHPILQTKFMTGAFRDIIAAPLRGAARQATGRGKMSKEDTAYVAGALKEFSGVLMMGGLLGGLTALPFYTIMAHALAEGFDEEDDDDVRKLMKIDPRTAYDADLMFRSWIMEHLGTADKGDVDLADIVLGGVPGAATDTELSSTLSLDLVNMWYREPIAGDSLESTMTAALIANVAGLSMVSQMLKSYEDFEKDNTGAALKKLLPAFFRGAATAYYSADEGIKTRKGDTIIPKEDITGSDMFRSLLGARSARLARWQDYYITAKKNEDRIEGEKKDILDELERKIDSGEINSQAKLNEFMSETIVPFNRTYPDPDLVITETSIIRSLKGRAEREARTEQGMLVSRKSPEQERKSAAPFRPK